MSCKLIDFYNSLNDQERQTAKYQDKPNCYSFDPFTILGRINAYSVNFFDLTPTQRENKFSAYQKEFCTFGVCDSIAYSPKLSENDICSNEDFFYNYNGTYNITKQNKYADCYIGNTSCTVGVYADVTTNNTSYCTNSIAYEGSTLFPSFRSVGNNIVFNDSFPNVEFCPDSTREQTYQCIFKSQNLLRSNDNYNVMTLYDKNNFNAGGMTMEIYQTLSDKPTMGDLTKAKDWRKALIAGKYPAMSGQILPVSFSYPLYIISYIFSIIHLFYFQVYNDYTKNDFNSVTVMGSNNGFQNYLSQLVSLSRSGDSSIPFLNSINNVNLYSQYFCLLPTIKEKDNNQFQIQISLHYELYKQINSYNDKTSFIQRLMTSVIDDGASANVKYIDTSTNTSIVTNTATYENLVWDSTKMQCVYFDFTNYNVKSGNIQDYLVQNKSLSEFLKEKDNNKNVFLMTISTTIDIQTWSPMLYVYAKSTFNIPTTITKSFADKLYKDTNGLYPAYSSFSKDMCENTDNYTCYYNNCKYLFIPSSKRCSEPYIAATCFFSMSSDCNCIRTNITPINVSPQYANKTSMCYTNNCSTDQLDKFSIDPQYCIQNCSKVSSWLNNSDKSYNIQNSNQFNTEKYQSYCRVTPLFTFNYYYFILIWVSFIAISLLIGRFLKKLKKFVIFMSVFNVIAFGISIFMGFFLSGSSFCYNRENICYSNLFSNTQIPNSCCNSQVGNCQCIFNSDCGNPNFYCASGLCVPYTDVNYVKTETEVNPVYDITLFGINFILVLVTIFVFLKNHAIEKTMIIIGVTGIYVICFLLLQTYYWKEVDINYDKK